MSDLPETKPLAPLNQKQEDVLIELFLELTPTDRKRVIKLCRDLVREAKEKQ